MNIRRQIWIFSYTSFNKKKKEIIDKTNKIFKRTEQMIFLINNN